MVRKESDWVSDISASGSIRHRRQQLGVIRRVKASLSVAVVIEPGVMRDTDGEEPFGFKKASAVFHVYGFADLEPVV